jgi:hypothetical protein
MEKLLAGKGIAEDPMSLRYTHESPKWKFTIKYWYDGINFE